MRYSLLLLPLAVLSLGGCVAGGASSSHQTSTTGSILAHAATYLTPEQSGKIITLPGDSTTVAQMRPLSSTSMNEPDNRQPSENILKPAGL
jgi:hypothetical protein